MEKSTRKIQIGVMGSAADLKYSKNFEKLAEEIGYWVAKNKAVLIFGAEKDYDSLSTAACRGAKKANGLTIGVTYGKGLNVYEKNVDVVIASGLERGGGRELTLVLSCDAIIALNGGSGTLTEIAIAYQANIPVVVLENSGGWSKKLGGKYLDDRKRIKIEVAKTPKEAVKLAIRLANEKSGDKQPKKDILFVAATHGDETIGAKSLEKLEKTQYAPSFDWIIGNLKSFKTGRRYINIDLNRVFPGSAKSKKYEEKRANEIINLTKKYKFIIDLHGTNNNTGIFIIITNPKLQNLVLGSMFEIPKIVIWPSTNTRKTGSLTRFIPCGFEIECGSMDNETSRRNLQKIIESFLEKYESRKLQNMLVNFGNKEIYLVYGKLEKYNSKKKLRNFEEINILGEKFYPLLIDQYKKIKCYKMRKINISQILIHHHNHPLQEEVGRV